VLGNSLGAATSAATAYARFLLDEANVGRSAWHVHMKRC